MTKDEAYRAFKIKHPRKSFIGIDGRIDVCAMNEAWGVYIDMLCKSHVITLQQYERWGNPCEHQMRRQRRKAERAA